jgi:hypothetical protein
LLQVRYVTSMGARARFMKTKLTTIRGQPSWRIANEIIEAFITQTGGHLGPVEFRLGDQIIQPFAVAPWAEEKTDPSLLPILKVLRGDFFCLPFGANSRPYRGEQHPVHGETANAQWRLESAAPDNLHLSLATKIRPGRVDKYVSLRPEQAVVYQRHVVSGMKGPMNLGHHAMLQFPEEPGSGHVSTSRFREGQVLTTPFEDPVQGGYYALRVGATFRSLEKVPLANGGFTDLSLYPARRGFEDLVMLNNDDRLPFAWTAVTFPDQRYVWFALKDPRVLRQTVFWLSNGGRYYPPWSGRHVGVMGLEEVTAYFHYGIAESVSKNPLSAKGSATCLQLNPKTPLTVNYIMAVAPIPKGFDQVAEIVSSRKADSVQLTARSRLKIEVALDLGFLRANNA